MDSFTFRSPMWFSARSGMKCGLNWWLQSSSLLPDVQIIKITTVTGITLQLCQRIQISLLTGYSKAMEKWVLQNPGWSALWGSTHNGCSDCICSMVKQMAPISKLSNQHWIHSHCRFKTRQNSVCSMQTLKMKVSMQLIYPSFHGEFIVHTKLVYNGKPAP